MNRSVYIIAEAGVNHNGDLEIAKKLVETAKQVGANAIKFQTFKAEQIVTKNSPKAKYQLAVTDRGESQYDMLKKLELNSNVYEEIIELCKVNEIDFLSTPYNIEDIEFLEKFNVSSYKVASGQLTELPFLRYLARKNKRMYISTGMATLADVFLAVEAIRDEGNNDIVVLQCTTNYPSRIEDANILAMNSIKEACNVSVGYSDHVPSNYACYTAVALGAEVIEKHFTLDKSMEGPDHSSSLDPEGFRELIEGIRNIELALGSKVKRPSKIELENSKEMKRGMVVLEDLAKGTVLKESHIGFKRPLRGVPINMLPDIIGKETLIDLKADDNIGFDAIKW